MVLAESSLRRIPGVDNFSGLGLLFLPWVVSFLSFFRACRAYGLGEQFNAAAQEEGTFAEWLDELPIEVDAATARRLLKHHARSGAWIEIHPGSPSQAPRPSLEPELPIRRAGAVRL